jgi:hypothetical protein
VSGDARVSARTFERRYGAAWSTSNEGKELRPKSEPDAKEFSGTLAAYEAWNRPGGPSNKGKELRPKSEPDAKGFRVTQAAIILSGESAKGTLNEGQANAAA